MNYFLCDQILGEHESLLKFLVVLAKGYSTLHQVKRHMLFQLERYLAVASAERAPGGARLPQVLQERLDEGQLHLGSHRLQVRDEDRRQRLLGDARQPAARLARLQEQVQLQRGHGRGLFDHPARHRQQLRQPRAKEDPGRRHLHHDRERHLLRCRRCAGHDRDAERPDAPGHLRASVREVHGLRRTPHSPRKSCLGSSFPTSRCGTSRTTTST